MASEQNTDNQSLVGKSRGYFADSWAEVKKVSMPSRQETVQATLATIVIIVFFSLCLFMFDFFCHWFMGLLLKGF